MSKHQLSVAVSVVLVASSLAFAEAPPVMPPIIAPLPKPDAAGQKPRATVTLAPYRYDYYMGADWDKGLDLRDRAAWEAYVRDQKPDFEPRDGFR